MYWDDAIARFAPAYTALSARLCGRLPEAVCAMAAVSAACAKPRLNAQDVAEKAEQLLKDLPALRSASLRPHARIRPVLVVALVARERSLPEFLELTHAIADRADNRYRVLPGFVAYALMFADETNAWAGIERAQAVRHALRQPFWRKGRLEDDAAGALLTVTQGSLNWVLSNYALTLRALLRAGAPQPYARSAAALATYKGLAEHEATTRFADLSEGMRALPPDMRTLFSVADLARLAPIAPAAMTRAALESAWRAVGATLPAAPLSLRRAVTVALAGGALAGDDEISAGAIAGVHASAALFGRKNQR